MPGAPGPGGGFPGLTVACAGDGMAWLAGALLLCGAAESQHWSGWYTSSQRWPMTGLRAALHDG